MARIGWVSAGEVGTDDWYRPAVFDDGWVDLPGFAGGYLTPDTKIRALLGRFGTAIGG